MSFVPSCTHPMEGTSLKYGMGQKAKVIFMKMWDRTRPETDVVPLAVPLALSCSPISLISCLSAGKPVMLGRLLLKDKQASSLVPSFLAKYSGFLHPHTQSLLC